MNKSTRKLTAVLTITLMTIFYLLAGCPGDGRGVVEDKGPGDEFERIVIISPALTEIVYAIGQGDRVVGVCDYTTFPDETEDLPRCGGVLNPSLEAILSLNPDLILTQGKAEDLKKFGERYGMAVISLELGDLGSIYDAIERVGDKLGSENEADGLVSGMKELVSAVEKRVEGRKPVDTLLVFGRDPASLREIHVVGDGGFLNDLLGTAGGNNIVGDVDREYFSISKEVILKEAPEAIIELHGKGDMEAAERKEYLSPWRRMDTVPAVKNERVYVIEETFAMLPGPRVVKIAEEMSRLLHPDAW